MTTKIIATLGPASMSRETIKALALAGARIFRLNFSHSVAADFEPVIKVIRDVESEIGKPLTALGDLCGPKTRIGEIADAPRQVDKGEILRIVYLGVGILGLNTVLGVLLHARERPAGLWLFASGGMLQCVLLVAAVVAIEGS